MKDVSMCIQVIVNKDMNFHFEHFFTLAVCYAVSLFQHVVIRFIMADSSSAGGTWWNLVIQCSPFYSGLANYSFYDPLPYCLLQQR